MKKRSTRRGPTGPKRPHEEGRTVRLGVELADMIVKLAALNRLSVQDWADDHLMAIVEDMYVRALAAEVERRRAKGRDEGGGSTSG